MISEYPNRKIGERGLKRSVGHDVVLYRSNQKPWEVAGILVADGGNFSIGKYQIEDGCVISIPLGPERSLSKRRAYTVTL